MVYIDVERFCERVHSHGAEFKIERDPITGHAPSDSDRCVVLVWADEQLYRVMPQDRGAFLEADDISSMLVPAPSA
jgi:hypothetical protein